VEFRRFNVQQGYDRTGVPTDMVSLESVVRMSFSNPSRHYGAFVSGATVGLSYLPRPIAHGQVNKNNGYCFQRKLKNVHSSIMLM
jgi:hypothetical protein